MKDYQFPYDNYVKYARNAGGAILRGKFYLFGGPYLYDLRKIAILNDCSFERISAPLIYNHAGTQQLVTLPDDSKVLLCFYYDSDIIKARQYKNCQFFDGILTGETKPSEFTHKDACIGRFGDDILAVGSNSPGDIFKVEKRNHQTENWSSVQDLPYNNEASYGGASCIGFSDALILIGGDGPIKRKIYLYKKDQWRLIGYLFERHVRGDLVAFGTEIYATGDIATEKFYYDDNAPFETFSIQPEIFSYEIFGEEFVMFDGAYDSCSKIPTTTSTTTTRTTTPSTTITTKTTSRTKSSDSLEEGSCFILICLTLYALSL